jgi:hypothetical protein
MNDCHDPETGQFCEDAGSLGIKIGTPVRKGARIEADILSGYKPKHKGAKKSILWHYSGMTGVKETGPMHLYNEVLVDRRDKSNANDCHDEEGKFCEGGGSSGPNSASGVRMRDGVMTDADGNPLTTGGGALGRAARDHERMRRDDANPGGSRISMEARESLRIYTDKALRAAPPGEREAIDYDRHQLGKEPIDWAKVDEKPPKPTGGIGPERSVTTAEKRGKEYGYSKKVSFYQCKSVDQANEINTQLAELSDETGLVLERVYVYKETNAKEAPSSALGYSQTTKEDLNTLGFRNGVTAEYCKTHCVINHEGRREDMARWEEKIKSGGPSADYYRSALEEARAEEGFEGFTYTGNGVRNPIVDHEFAHALADRAMVSKPKSDMWGKPLPQSQAKGYYINSDAQKKLNNLGDWCREFNQEKKFSVYGSKNSPNSLFIKSGEPLAETYAYWKAGNSVPERIEKGFKRLETFRRPE